eukprot:6185426-Pleurochrysis_carterae.AAC.1
MLSETGRVSRPTSRNACCMSRRKSILEEWSKLQYDPDLSLKLLETFLSDMTVDACVSQRLRVVRPSDYFAFILCASVDDIYDYNVYVSRTFLILQGART